MHESDVVYGWTQTDGRYIKTFYLCVFIFVFEFSYTDAYNVCFIFVKLLEWSRIHKHS